VAGYRIDGVLGQGGMGVVYRATQLSLNREVALKLLAPELSDDPGFRARFQREGQLQAALDHQHIVPVYEAGQADQGLFMAMRLIDGPTLKVLILEGRLDSRRSLRILAQVAQALDAAHEAGLIHRDIKPQNILIERGDRVYLADFGLIKAPGEAARLTDTGQFIGTIDYVAPEQIQGEAATATSDCYALAAVLYECLTGEVPFPRQSEAAVLHAHVIEPPPRVTDVRPDLPAAIDEVVVAGMAKDPTARPASAVAMIRQAVQALATGPRNAAGAQATRLSPRPDVRDGGSTTVVPGAVAVVASTAAPVQNAVAVPDPLLPVQNAIAAPDPLPSMEAAVAAPDTLPSIENAVAAPDTLPPIENAVAAPDTLPPIENAVAAPDTLPPTETAASDPLRLAVATEPAQTPSPSPAPATTDHVLAPSPPAERPAARPGRLGPIAILLVLAAAAVVLGFLLGNSGTGGSSPSFANSATAGPIQLRYPSGWQLGGSLPALPGTSFGNQVVLDRSPGAEGLTAGTVATAGGPTLLAPSFRARLAGALPPPAAVRLGTVEAYRYSDLQVRGLAGTVTVYAAPTSAGVVTIACLSSSAAAGSFLTDCGQVAATLRLLGVTAYPLGPSAVYGHQLSLAFDRLRAATTGPLAALHAANTPRAQAAAARQVARAYAAAAQSLSGANVSPQLRDAQSAIVGALTHLAAAYSQAAAAAQSGSTAAYNRAGQAIGTASAALGASLRALDGLGYTVAAG
jgi:serine/threonine protein kinase